jgi:pimeloyl-ACP methyl ester carboxylesterase
VTIQPAGPVLTTVDLACSACCRTESPAQALCGLTDFGWEGVWDGYDEDEATLMRIADEAEAVAWCQARYGPDGSGFLEGDMGGLPPADQAALEDETLATEMLEAFRQGVGGYAQDIVVLGRPWRFDTNAIVAPVWILHGEADTLVPVTQARHTAEMIPRARLLTLPDHGHFSIGSEIPNLTTDLVSALR